MTRGCLLEGCLLLLSSSTICKYLAVPPLFCKHLPSCWPTWGLRERPSSLELVSLASWGDRLLNNESSVVDEAMSSLEYSKSCDGGHCFCAPRESQGMWGPTKHFNNCKNTTEMCSVNLQCQNSGKKFPSGVTCGDRRAASLPSL